MDIFNFIMYALIIISSLISYIYFNRTIKLLKNELKKHDILTSDKLKRNVEYQMDFENYINEKELDILFFNFRKLNSEQQDRFLAMYRYIDTIPKDKRSWAYSQIMRTLNKG